MVIGFGIPESQKNKSICHLKKKILSLAWSLACLFAFTHLQFANSVQIVFITFFNKKKIMNSVAKFIGKLHAQLRFISINLVTSCTYCIVFD